LAHELTSRHADLLAAIRNEKQLSSSSEAQLKAALEKFVSVFA
jgi:F0F1-type ATP synthase alpha subunit